VSQILYFRDVTHETEVDQMKSEFLSTAAHELRTPMASVYGFSEVLLSQDYDAATQREFLTIIHEQSKQMSDILNELLDLARIEARRGKDFRYTRICLQDLIQDLVKAFKLPPRSTLPELVMPLLPLYVMADAGKLRQAILNVLSNAYKYSTAGTSVVFEIETTPGTGQPTHINIHIADHGMGMTPEQLARVCERFYRADTSGRIPGTGLGMSIVKEIIELHGGHITMASAVGQGTRVSLCLPAQPAVCQI
jgi:signal transduction histidine kinase